MTTKITYKGYINYKPKGQLKCFTYYFSGISDQEFETLKTRFSNPEMYVYIGANKTRDKIELGNER